MTAVSPTSAPGEDTNNGQASPPPKPERVNVGSGVKVPLIILATIASFAALDYAQSLLLPVVLAFVISLTLTPINLWLQKRIWAGLSALLLVGVLTIGVGLAVATLSTPISSWIDDAPRIGAQLRERLKDFRGPVDSITRASREVDEITQSTTDTNVGEVVVRQPGLLNRAATNLSSIASTVVVAIALTYFLLVTNRLIYEKIVHSSPKLSDKKRSLTVVNNIVTIVSKYLLTITLINAGFGVCIFFAFWIAGMPSPAVWGLAAFLLNFLPFVGSLVGTVSSALVALIAFDSIEWALVPPIAYFTITTIEGHFITPAVLGHRLEINPVAILLSIALWGFLWGVPGVIIAVPILIITKVVADNVPPLAGLGVFLSGATAAEEKAEERAEKDSEAGEISSKTAA
ncbi:AI-2E family transporter [Acuticoccus sp. MNP-M23]|uniref:AI-2E family transporter n=1 Tax=Acuticoccus sp. MNP-M23 TaxID=3072793 RepID=UPI0028160ABC|nr:AI-2E family transporter [Acuticoccus sp. MNP-M23]WMS42082.1 AI-2E family transporter [Acuticoccus sp. MNP-M23]